MNNRTTLLTLLATFLMLVACDTKTKTVDSCGDSFLDPGEECDLTQVPTTNCQTLGYYEQSAPISCRSNCTLNLDVCTLFCGDGVISTVHGEDCDGNNLAGLRCSDLGLGGGELSCNGSCRFDTDECEISAVCGDGVLAYPYEACEQGDLHGETCQSQGFGGGTLTCTSTCELNLSSCNEGECGDTGVICRGDFDCGDPPGSGFTICHEECCGSICAVTRFVGGMMAATLDSENCGGCGVDCGGNVCCGYSAWPAVCCEEGQVCGMMGCE